jgi:hypothetical protein
MHIKEYSWENDDYRSFLKIYVNDKLAARFYDGEPEDNSLCRNFSDCYSITDLMKRAYDAGKNGEEFMLETVEGEPE